MKLLIKQARLVTPDGVADARTDLLIDKGVIAQMGTDLTADDAKVITSPDLHVSAGWFDLHAHFCDPGLEHKEDLTSGSLAAAHGGFTGVALMPGTNPPIDSKSGVEYLKKMTRDQAVDIHPVGAATQHMEGQELSEMYDMHQAGAVAFSDDKNGLRDPNMMQRVLLYTQGFDGLLLHYPFEERLAPEGVAHEGTQSTSLGLRGIPALSEELAINRDLYLVDYTQGRIHFQTVSTAGAVEQIRAAKAKGMQVTAEVSVTNLVETDEALKEFDTNYKVMPPLRGNADVAALIQGLEDGTIDAICSDHRPENEENKVCEFEHAAFGMAAIETVFPLLNSRLNGKLPLSTLVNKLAHQPRKILRLETPAIAKGAPANLTVFDPTLEWTWTRDKRGSKALNSPFLDTTFTGKVIGIANNDQWVGTPA